MNEEDFSAPVVARALIRGRGEAVLATLMAEGGGPYASLVLVACGHDLSPVMLISTLAEHTRNIQADARISLLYDGTAGLEDRLTGPRLTLTGRAERTEDADLARRYLAHHPAAAGYAGFADFAYYRMIVERAHLVAGFGRIHWLSWQDIVAGAATPAPLAAAEEEIIAHMNADHADALPLYAAMAAGREAPAGADWRMVGIDCEGFDLLAGAQRLRLSFDKPIGNADDARKALVAMLKRARQMPGGGT